MRKTLTYILFEDVKNLKCTNILTRWNTLEHVHKVRHLSELVNNYCQTQKYGE